MSPVSPHLFDSPKHVSEFYLYLCLRLKKRVIIFRNINFVRHLIRFILCFDRRNGLMDSQFKRYAIRWLRNDIFQNNCSTSFIRWKLESDGTSGNHFPWWKFLPLRKGNDTSDRSIQVEDNRDRPLGLTHSGALTVDWGENCNNYGERTLHFPNWPLNIGSNVVRLVFSPKNSRRNTCFWTVVEFVCFCAYWTFSKNGSNSFLLK